jgi:hypothetical protein
MNTKGKISYGNVEVDDEDLRPSNVRRRISIMIPEDVIAKLTTIGRRENEGYQTVINRILREAVASDDGGSVCERLSRVEVAVRELLLVQSILSPSAETTKPPEGGKGRRLPVEEEIEIRISRALVNQVANESDGKDEVPPLPPDWHSHYKP